MGEIPLYKKFEKKFEEGFLNLTIYNNILILLISL
jgi:hypothetical protein